jgi:hypothetical protein
MGVLRLLPALAMASCFAPELDGLYACRIDADCPSDLVCATDGLCRHDRGNNPRDAGVDLPRPPEVASDLSRPVDQAAPEDLSTPADLAMPDLSPTDMACKPLKCMPGDCGNLDNGCGGVVHCKRCPD